MSLFKTNPNPSLTRQLIVYLSLSIGLVIVLSAFFAIKNTRDSVFKLHDDKMAKSAEILLSFLHYELLEESHSYDDSDDDDKASEAEDDLVEELAEVVDKIRLQQSLAVNYRVKVNNTTLFTAPNLQGFSVCAPGFSSIEANHVATDSPESVWRCYQMSQTLYSANATVSVELFEPMTERYQSIQSLISSAFLPIFLLPVFICIALIWAVRAGIKRVTNLSQSVAKRSAVDLTKITRDGHPAELLPVVDSVNNLIGDMQRSIEREKQFTDDAAHELRTPLTSIKMLEQLMRREVKDPALDHYIDDLKESVDNSSALIDQLLELARLQSTDTLDMEALDIHELVQEQLGLLSPLLTEKNMSIDLQCGDTEIKVMASRHAIMLVISNLLSNAIKFSPMDTTIKITINQNGLQIQDSGPGIPADEYSKIFERFYRGSSAGTSSGSGLGLALAQRIAQLHDFTLTAEAPSSGTGACLNLRFKTT